MLKSVVIFAAVCRDKFNKYWGDTQAANEGRL